MASPPSENGFIANLLASISIVGLLGYGIHFVLTGLAKFKEKVFDKLDEKQDKKQCDIYRDLEEKVVQRIDNDLQEHKREDK